MSFDGEPGTDFWGYPKHDPPGYLKPPYEQIFLAIEDEIVNQCRIQLNSSSFGQGHGYVMFRKDLNGFAVLDCQLNIGKLVERIQDVLEEEPVNEPQLALE